jgi:hypothetical protein
MLLPPNFSDALLVFLYGVMATLFVQSVLGMFKFKERVDLLEGMLRESCQRLINCEDDMYAFGEVQRALVESQRLTEKERPRLRLAKPAERRTGAGSPRRGKK